MRLDNLEKEALEYAFKDFEGDVYIYGSRLDDSRKGGDIDVMIITDRENNTVVNGLQLILDIQKRFFLKCEQKLDVMIYKENEPFCREVIKNAKRIDIKAIG